MEHVEGTHLEAMVGQAPLSIAQTCELAWQIAGALEETHKRQLVHRDIKPSNILVTPRHVAKLLDFGLAIHFAGSRLTSPGTLLGTLSYMAPEQIADSGNVDIRADIFGLGATVFFCLTGKPPFPSEGNMTQQVAARLTQAAPAVRSLRPDVSPELDAVIARMLAHHCTDRFSTPQSLIRALSPFVNASARYADRSVGLAESEILPSSAASVTRPRLGSMNEMERSCPRVLIVDDEAPLRQLCTQFFRAEGFDCQTACNGKEALTALAARTFSLVLLDIDMPEMSGRETLRHLRQDAPAGNPKVIMMSGGVPPDEMSALLALGADDYVTKPLNRLHLVARVRAALAHKATDDRSETLNQQLLRLNAELEDRVAARSSDLFQVRNALLFALAQAVETRARDTTRGHLARVARGAVALARQARNGERFTRAIDGAFVRVLAVCAPLHDIGYIALPDHIVHAPGPLGPEDRIILQAHTTIGADTLASVGKRDSSAGAFWRMAIDITRHHHERFDGTGYPDRLAGHDIPLPARLVAIADTYDMLRTAGELGYALAHNAAVEWMVGGARGRFDPALVQAFQECEHDFEEISRTSPSRDGSSPQDCPLVSQLSLGTSGPFG
jgi:response regulator RpfG family c-di-GMP phosphodiesterase